MIVPALIVQTESTEILTLLFSNLKTRQLEVVRAVCHQWHAVANYIILQRLYGIIPDAIDPVRFFFDRSDLYCCEIDQTPKGLICKKIPAFPLKKTQNPLLLKLKLARSTMTGGELVAFAQDHPQLMMLAVTQCKKIDVNHISVALTYLKNLRSISLEGEGMFDPELLFRLLRGHPILGHLKIIDPSGPAITDQTAWKRLDSFRSSVKIVIELSKKLTLLKVR